MARTEEGLTADRMRLVLGEHREDLARRFGVVSLALFGSFARGEASAASDVDLLVGFREPPVLSRYMALKFHLEDLLGRRVDLVMKDALRPWARPAVERDAIDVA